MAKHCLHVFLWLMIGVVQSFIISGSRILSTSFFASSRNHCDTKLAAALERRGPITPAPVYEGSVGGGLIDGLLYRFFRQKVVERLGQDSDNSDFAGLIESIRKLNQAYPTKRETQVAAQDILRSLFPSWLPGAFAVIFAKPFPGISARMNAYITKLTTYWLMGDSELIDVDIDGGQIGKGQGLLVKRCRYLEEAGCASVCVNTCKVPTQNFFGQNMGLPLTMTPDYDTYELSDCFRKKQELSSD